MLCHGRRLPSWFSRPNQVKAIDSNFGAVYVTLWTQRLEILTDGAAHAIDCREVTHWRHFTAADGVLTQGTSRLRSRDPLVFDLELTNRSFRCVWRVSIPGGLELLGSVQERAEGIWGRRAFGTETLEHFDDRLVLCGKTFYEGATASDLQIYGTTVAVRLRGWLWLVRNTSGLDLQLRCKFAIPGPRCVFLIRGRSVEHVDTLTGAVTVLASTFGQRGGISLPKNPGLHRLVYVPDRGDLLLLRGTTTIVPMQLRGVVVPWLDLNPDTFHLFPRAIRDLVRLFLFLARRFQWPRAVWLYALSFVFTGIPCARSIFGVPTK